MCIFLGVDECFGGGWVCLFFWRWVKWFFLGLRFIGGRFGGSNGGWFSVGWGYKVI